MQEKPTATLKGGPAPCSLQPEPLVLTKNGSYLAYFRLQEHVAVFRDFLRQNARTPDDEKLLAAKLMGRWRSGAPLVLSPDRDDPTLGKDLGRTNDFDYGTMDPHGYKCPIGAHIRRVTWNPELPGVHHERPVISSAVASTCTEGRAGSGSAMPNGRVPTPNGSAPTPNASIPTPIGSIPTPNGSHSDTERRPLDTDRVRLRHRPRPMRHRPRPLRHRARPLVVATRSGVRRARFSGPCSGGSVRRRRRMRARLRPIDLHPWRCRCGTGPRRSLPGRGRASRADHGQPAPSARITRTAPSSIGSRSPRGTSAARSAPSSRTGPRSRRASASPSRTSTTSG